MLYALIIYHAAGVIIPHPRVTILASNLTFEDCRSAQLNYTISHPRLGTPVCQVQPQQ